MPNGSVFVADIVNVIVCIVQRRAVIIILFSFVVFLLVVFVCLCSCATIVCGE